MYTLLRNKKRYIAYERDGLFVVDDMAVLKNIKEGKMKIGLEDFTVIKSDLYDYMVTIRRKAQIISIKDAAYIVARCGIRSGFRVIEGGAGSGSLTTALLYFTHPDGHVYTYELRKDFAEIAMENVRRLPFDNWTLKIGDVTKDVAERDVDAFIVDIPEPWEAVDTARKTLRNGGCFCSYVPTYNQMEKVYHSLEKEGFIDLEATEIIKRNMHIGERGTRPENIEIGHTGFLIFGRKISDEIEN